MLVNQSSIRKAIKKKIQIHSPSLSGAPSLEATVAPTDLVDCPLMYCVVMYSIQNR